MKALVGIIRDWERRSFVRYGIISVLSFALNLGMTVALHEWARWPEELAYAIALVVVMLTNFLCLRYYIYPGRHGNWVRQLLLFLASSAVFRAMEYAAFLVFHTWIGLPYVPVIVVVQAVSVMGKFLYYGLAVFNTKPDERVQV